MIGSSWPSLGAVTLADGDEVEIVRETVPFEGLGDAGIGIERPRDPGLLVQGWCNQADLTVPIPYWAEIWPASRAIARRLLSGPERAGQSVLDLGCGLGLTGIAAALRGARVTFADHHPDALAFARRNARAAGIREDGFLLVDWRDPAWSRPFDLVLGADVIYDRSEHEAIARLLERLLCEGGTAWLGDPCRESALPFLTAWLEAGRFATTVKVGAISGDDVETAIHDLRLR